MAYVDINGVGGVADYVPTKYAPKLRDKWYNQSVLPQLMDTEYEGILKKGGTTVKIRNRPTITGAAYTKGQDVTYPYYTSTSQDLIIDQSYLWSFAVDDVDAVQVDLNFINDWIDEATQQQRIYTETIILNAAPAVVPAANKGLNAGAVSGNINLGTTVAPLYLTQKESYTDATTGISWYNAADLMVDFCTVLAENKVPRNMEKFAIMPAIVENKIAKSDIKRADVTGDGTGVIRRGPDYIGEVGGVNTYMTNLFTAIAGGFAGNLNVLPILFGVKQGWTFAAQIESVKAFDLQTKCGMGHRGLWVFGWAVKIEEGLGVAYITTSTIADVDPEA